MILFESRTRSSLCKIESSKLLSEFISSSDIDHDLVIFTASEEFLFSMAARNSCNFKLVGIWKKLVNLLLYKAGDI